MPLEDCFGVRSRCTNTNGFDKSSNGRGTQADDVVKSSSTSAPPCSTIPTSNGHKSTLDSLQTAILERDEAERQERESPVLKPELREYHPLTLIIHDVHQALSKTAVLVRLIVEKFDLRVERTAETMIEVSGS